MSGLRRAGTTGDALRRGFTPVPPAREPVEGSSAHDAITKPVEPKKASKGSKYTAVLDDDTAAAFDELALRGRRALGRRVEKIELLSTLIMLAADDASLRDQVFALVEERRRR